MTRYPILPPHLRAALTSIVPSEDGELAYYPCRVTLTSGVILDAVYVEPEQPYLRAWDVYPENDPGKRVVRIEEVAAIEDSPMRLPVRFANEIYRDGESGMGYTAFTIVFADGQRQAYISGNAVDFIQYPDGKGPNDVVGVLTHQGRESSPLQAPEWYWCLYSE
jgi:hypothetical protein